MGQPKHRTSKSKRNHRRSHHTANLPNLIFDKDTNTYKKPHFVIRKKRSNRNSTTPEVETTDGNTHTDSK